MHLVIVHIGTLASGAVFVSKAPAILAPNKNPFLKSQDLFLADLIQNLYQLGLLSIFTHASQRDLILIA